MSLSEQPGKHRRSKAPPRRWIVQLVAATVTVAAAVAIGTGMQQSSSDRLPEGSSAHLPGSPPSASAPTTPSSPTASPTEGRSNDALSRPGPPRESEPSSEERVVIPESGPGTFRSADGGSSHSHSPRASELTYTVEVEAGLPYAPAETAVTIEAILDDDRGWSSAAGRSLHRVATGSDIRVLLATPSTTDELCAPLQTRGRVSCRNGDLVVLNARRWAFGTDDYRGRLPQYRTYLVNHEVGHALGYGHVRCPGDGEPAPVMQQQTYGLDGCRRNAWPSVSR